MGDVPEGAYTWCSRGPAIDGYKGVDVYAPGRFVTIYLLVILILI